MELSKIKIERTLSLTGSQWDSLVIACDLALHSLDVLTRQSPVKYVRFQSDISTCFATLLETFFGDALHSSST